MKRGAWIAIGIAALLTGIHMLVIRNVLSGAWVWETGQVFLLNTATTFFSVIIVAMMLPIRRNILLFWIVVFAISGVIVTMEARVNDRNRDAVVARLSSSDTNIRLQAARTLAEIGYSAAVPALARSLHDPNEEVRRLAAGAIAKSENRDGVAPLTAALDDASVDVQRAAIDALSSLHDARAVPALARFIDRGDPMAPHIDQYLKSFAPRSSPAPVTLPPTAYPHGLDNARSSAAALLFDLDHANAALLRAYARRDIPIIGGAWKFFVGRALAGSEPLLAASLDRVGTKEMAEAFLNCGNSRLHDAAQQWAPAHGFKIEMGHGAVQRWGESAP